MISASDRAAFAELDLLIRQEDQRQFVPPKRKRGRKRGYRARLQPVPPCPKTASGKHVHWYPHGKSSAGVPRSRCAACGITAKTEAITA